MRITPLDVRKQEFDRALRGLDPDEVHAFLATVADEYEAVLTDNKQLREKVIELDQKVAEYRNMERTLRDTLLTAERVMTDARQNARKEAENILREAEVKAREATANIQNQVDALRAQMRELRGQRDGFLARLHSLAEAQIGLTESYRKDFKDDDARSERLMRDPDGAPAPLPTPTVDVAPSNPMPITMVPQEPVSQDPVSHDPAPTEPTFHDDGPSASGPIDPTPSGSTAPVTPASGTDQDDWRNYDLKVGAAPATPTPPPIDTQAPRTEPTNEFPTENAAPAADSGAVEVVTADDVAPATDESTITQAVNEVTEAVDSALDDSGVVTPLPPTSTYVETEAPTEPGLSPALEAAEAAGQASDTLAGPDMPEATGETPIDGDAEDGTSRWSLSRFTKGLSSF